MARSTQAAASSAPQMTPQQANMLNRQACVRQGVDMWQSVFATSGQTAIGGVYNIPLRNVGLVKRLLVKVTFTIVNSSGPTQTLTVLGPANFFSNITFTDLSNQTRINTAGWHLAAVSSGKRRRVWGAAMTTDTPLGYGSSWNTGSSAQNSIIYAPSTIASAATVNGGMMFEVPFSYTDHDLRGAIYANVTNATFNLQLTVNPNLFLASGFTDNTLAMYSSSGAVPTSITYAITVYQNYLDQLPINQAGVPALPLLDLSTAYLLNNTPVAAVVANQDNPIPYANFRDFMSTCLIFDNGGTLNTGSDVNYISIQSANYTNILKVDPQTSALLSRLIIGDDFPKGFYYFDHRAKPISTIQYGNMQLVVNPISAATGAAFLMGYEALALINMITQAGSLYGS